MKLSRRDFIRASSAIAAGLALNGRAAFSAAQEGSTAPAVIWLQAQSCSGCSVSLLNTIEYMSADNLLTEAIDLKYHSTLMSSAGPRAIDEANHTRDNGGYVLVVEGSIPTAEFRDCCQLWPNTTAWDGVQLLASNAAHILAVGTCAAYGGVVAGSPNPTGAVSVGHCIGADNVINIPGCPAHPDWIVGTIAYLLNGELPELDRYGRPRAFFNGLVHDECPNRGHGERCLKPFGCKGQKTRADCPLRQWNAGSPGQGTNWCIGAGTPCHGCTEPDFPDGKSPFFTLSRPNNKKNSK